jgi:ribonuclease HI
MELTAVIEALHALAGTREPLDLCTDSTYVIRGITEWIHGWRRRGWKTAEGQPVLNRELWERLAAVVAARGPTSIYWHYVRGHSDIPGNERADAIAVAFAAGTRPPLYDGPLSGYDVDLHALPDDTSLPARNNCRGGDPSCSVSL